MMRNVLVLVLCSTMIAPAALAALPADRTAFQGEVDVSARHVYGFVPCDERVPLEISAEDRTPSVPERALFRLEMRDSRCGPQTLVVEGEMDGNGWRLGDGDHVRGALRPLDGTDGQWSFTLTLTTCPPGVICEFPFSHVRYEGVLEDRPTTM